MNVKPFGDQVLIEPTEGEDKTPSGIVLPDSAKEKPQKGTIKSLGTGGKDEKGNPIEFTVKVGDKVFYKKWGGNEIKVDGKELLIVKQDDILAIIEQHISWNNKVLDEDEINFAVQQIIDRLIFLRIAEDRHIEPYGNLKQTLGYGTFYQNLLDQFRRADDKYAEAGFHNVWPAVGEAFHPPFAPTRHRSRRGLL